MKLATSLSKKKKRKKPKVGLKHPHYAAPGPKSAQEVLGPKLQDGASEYFHNIFHSIYSRKEVKEKLEAVPHPQNCSALKPVMINKEIYSRMSEKERKLDEPMKYISNGVMKASQPLAAAWNSLLMVEDALRAEKGKQLDSESHVELQVTKKKVLDLTQVIEQLDQALVILGMTNCQVVQKRHWELKYKLAPEYKDLANKSQPFTEFLLGDNIKEAVVESKKERQLSFSATHGRHTSWGDQPFLDQKKSRPQQHPYQQRDSQFQSSFPSNYNFNQNQRGQSQQRDPKFQNTNQYQRNPLGRRGGTRSRFRRGSRQ